MGGWTFMCAQKSNFISCCWGNVSSLSLHRGWKASGWRPGRFPIDPTVINGMEWGGRLTNGNLWLGALRSEGVSFQALLDTMGKAKGALSNLSISIKA